VLKFIRGSDYGKLVAGDGSAGADYYHLKYPTALYVDETTSKIYIIDSGNQRRQRWIDEDFWTGGETLVKNELFLNAMDLPLDKCGNIYVSDRTNHTVLQYSLNNMENPKIIAGTGQRSHP
jgi:hypothetical protein